jgi:predicted RNA-binding Zn-ribbon protein involved in translation (DUF1610 family)
MRLHPTITVDRIVGAVERHMTTLDDPGFCIACGQDADGVEPDAVAYKCHSCGELAVYGAEELLLRTVA